MTHPFQFTVGSGSHQRSVRLTAQEPAEPNPAVPHAAVVLLHGAGGNLTFWTTRFAPLLLDAGIALYAPHYFDSTGTTYADLATIREGSHTSQWLRTVDGAVRFAASRPGVDPARIVVAGISLGAFLALAFAAQCSASTDVTERQRIRALVDISGGLVEPYASQATRHFAPTLILHGAADNIVPVTYATSLAERLTALDVAHRTEVLPNEGHWFSQAALPRMLLALSSFLQDHLDSHRQTHRAL